VQGVGFGGIDGGERGTKMKVWITKYALSKGVFDTEAEKTHRSETTITVKRGFSSDYYHRLEWHTTEVAAIAKAEQMRVKKIAALKKQIARLEKLTFEGEEAK
jgi:hypothetical protein